jgi:rhodanese-related sulfurtransferase
MSQAPHFETAQELSDLVTQGVWTLVDVREHGELAQTGTLRHAVHIPLMLLNSHADPRHPEFDKRIPSNAAIAVFCAAGGRASQAESMLRHLGYENVVNIGGFQALADAGMEVERQ